MISITGYTKDQQDALLAGKAPIPGSEVPAGYVATTDGVGGVTYTPPGSSDSKTIAPAVCFTWDDGDDTLHTTGQAILTNAGVAGTAFINASTIGGTNKLTWAQVEAFNENYLSTGIGYEIQCHENQHDYFDPTTGAAATALATSIETGLATLRSHGIMAHYLAYPGHQINMRGETLARKYYLGARCGGAPVINTAETVDLYRWGGTGISDSTLLTKAESVSTSLEARIEQLLAEPSGGIIVGCFHSFTPGRYAATWSAETLETAIGMIKAAGIRIINFSQANHELSNIATHNPYAGGI